MLQVKGIIEIVACAALLAGNYIAGKIIVSAFQPMAGIILRFSLATLCFIPFLNHQEWKKITKKDALLLLSAGFVGGTLYYYFFFNALLTTSVISLSLINATVPLLTIICMALIFFHVPTIKQIGTLILSFIGVFLVITQGNIGADMFKGHIGELLMCFAALSWTIYSIIIKVIAGRFSSVFIVFTSGLLGVLFLLPVSLINGYWEISTLTPLHIGAILYTGTIGTALGFFLYTNAIRDLGPSTANFILFSLEPMFVALFSYIILGDQITKWHFVGGIFVLVALAIHSHKRRPKKVDEETYISPPSP